MTTSYLDRGAGRIAYDVAGDGPLVVCLHGMGDHRKLFGHLAPALVGAGFRVATMDLRGHGESDDGFDSYDDVAAATDALALVAHLGGPALLVGNSMGAGAAVWAAAENPAAVTGLVLTGPFVRQPKTNPVMDALTRLMLLRPWGPAAWQAYLRKAQPGGDLDAYRKDLGAALGRGDHWRSFQRTTRTSHDPVEARLSEVRAPALVVMGEKDPDWPDPAAEARFVAETLHADLVMVPGAGHYTPAERPDLVNPAVIAFAERVRAGA